MVNAAEYIAVEDKSPVIFIERGIQTYETATRNTFDLSAVPLIKKLSHFPIIASFSWYWIWGFGATNGSRRSGSRRRWYDRRNSSRSCECLVRWPSILKRKNLHENDARSPCHGKSDARDSQLSVRCFNGKPATKQTRRKSDAQCDTERPLL